MKNRSDFCIVILVIVLLSVPAASADKSEANLVQKLTPLDSFHPDLGNDQYKEWHYFNFNDETNDLKFFVSFNVGGDLTKPTGTVVMAYMIGDQMVASLGYYPIQYVDVSDDSPDLTFDDSMHSNYVKLMPNSYKVHAEGVVLMQPPQAPIQMIYDATYIPKAEPTTIYSGLFGDTPGDMNWVSAASACRVEGSLTVDDAQYQLDGVRGYHDHNWGHWSWSDNVGWDWGQAMESNNEEPDTDVGRYTIVLGRLTDSNHILDNGNRLLLWKNKRQIGIFENVEFEYSMQGPYPEYITATATSGADSVTSVFRTLSGVPIIPDPPFTVWELTGTYTVTGTIDGKSIDFNANGFAEYAY